MISVKLEPPPWAAQAAALAALFENPVVVTDLESTIVAARAELDASRASAESCTSPLGHPVKDRTEQIA